MRHIVAGTAGHVDHGKSALVRALTGIEPDRLEEERRRGISIDLGFAYMDLAANLRIGFVDVPGHERFVRNMLAGAAGMDLVLFIIAADESIKPQTREHFDICRLLGVKNGIIVLTKADLVSQELLDLVRLEVEEFVAGSFLQGSPIVPVSSKTGFGLEMLRAALLETAKAIAPRSTTGAFRLPLDRAFSMKGFGTVVTGAAITGRISVDEEVEIYPTGRRARVRGIQVHGHVMNEAAAGQRTALNLAGVEPGSIARGHTISQPGLFRPTQIFDAELYLLPTAPALKHGTPIHFHAGTADVPAELRFFTRETAGPGSTSFARIALRAPLLLAPGDRFIIRRFSPVTTIGGGGVIEIFPPRMRRAGVPARLEKLRNATLRERLLLLLEETRTGLPMSELIALTASIAAEIEAAAQGPEFVRIGGGEPWFISSRHWQALQSEVLAAVTAYHQAEPLKPGAPREWLRSKAMPGAPAHVFNALIESSQEIVSEAESVRRRGHKPRLQDEEERAAAKIEEAFRAAGLTAPSAPDVVAACGVDPARARALLQLLFRDNRLTKISESLIYHTAAVEQLKSFLRTKKGQRFSVGSFKEWTGVSRKYAIPLLEYLDRERITRRVGEERLIL